MADLAPLLLRLLPSLALTLGLVALAGMPGCTEASDPAEVPLPRCTEVVRFGNAATCSAKDPTLSLCGGSSTRTCGNGWLCFDSPRAQDCGCETDADCAPRTDYINAARTEAGRAPLASKCVRGRCAGTP